MSKPRLTAGLFAAILLVIVLLPAGYMGAYYVMLESIRVSTVGHEYWSTPHYRVHTQLVRDFFWPANEVDKWMRPKRWPCSLATQY